MYPASSCHSAGGAAPTRYMHTGAAETRRPPGASHPRSYGKCRVWVEATTRRLNIIPSGKSGLNYLRESGMLTERIVPLPDDHDQLVEAGLREHPRKRLAVP